MFTCCLRLVFILILKFLRNKLRDGKRKGSVLASVKNQNKHFRNSRRKLENLELNFPRIIGNTEFPNTIGAGLWTCRSESYLVHLILGITLLVMSSFGHHHRGGGPSAPPCGSHHLKLDQACLQFLIPCELEKNVSFLAQSTECYQCEPWIIEERLSNGTLVPVNSTYGTEIILSSIKNTSYTICKDLVHFGQYGNYSLKVS